jgi:hypothetical protein
MVGCTTENWDWIKKFAPLADPNITKLFLMPVHVGWDRWFNELSKMPPMDAAARWAEMAHRLDDSLEDMIGWAAAHGHRLVVSGLGEIHHTILDDGNALRALADFERARALWLWEKGGMASMFTFSTGNINRWRVAAIAHALDVCRYDYPGGPIGVFCDNEYGPIWPTWWLGRNQTDDIPVDAEIDDELLFSHGFEDPHPDYADLARIRPGWLMGRLWLMGITQDENGEWIDFGIPELEGVLKMKREVGVDYIPHHTIPTKQNGEPFTGWWTCKNVWMSRLGFPTEQAGLIGAMKEYEHFYGRLRLPNGELEVPWSMWFAAGPGHGWDDYDIFRTDASAAAYVSHVAGKEPLPEDIIWPLGAPNGGLPPNGNGEVPTEVIPSEDLPGDISKLVALLSLAPSESPALELFRQALSILETGDSVPEEALWLAQSIQLGMQNLINERDDVDALLE